MINAAINKGPANNTEACLQHEITRLTGENFDLREKIENLGETIKRLKRQLKMYMKKLNEVGAALPVDKFELGSAADDSVVSEAGVESSEQATSAVVRKKETDYLGMFEYKRDQEQQVLKALIYGEL